MCLAIIALKALRDWPLIIIANRDELHSRPTLPANPWTDAPHILGGRDLSAGGTWLGLSAKGRLALLTNYREPGQNDPTAPSRGQLADEFLRGNALAQDFIAGLQGREKEYNGFNLLLGDRNGLWYFSNRGDVTAREIKVGVVGLSNASLDTPWPKLKRTRDAIAEHLRENILKPEPARLFGVMADTRSATLEELPDTGVGSEREKLLGSPFIKNERYGTRCTTLIMLRSDGMYTFHEKRFDSQGQQTGESRWTIDTEREDIQSDFSALDTRTL